MKRIKSELSLKQRHIKRDADRQKNKAIINEQAQNRKYRRSIGRQRDRKEARDKKRM